MSIRKRHFYIVLHSQSNVNDFPENTRSNFKVQLSEHVNLEGEWEVSLKQLIYPRSFFNVNQGRNKFSVSLSGETKSLSVVPGYYKTNDLLEVMKGEIQKAMPEALEHLNLTYHPQSQTVSVLVSGDVSVGAGLSFTEPSQIATLLGFPANKTFVCKDLERFGMTTYGNTINEFFVYSDIASNQIISSTKAPWLRTVRVSGNQGETVDAFFVDSYYVPLSKTHFDTIEILLADDHGQMINFQTGKVTAVMHFRPVFGIL